MPIERKVFELSPSKTNYKRVGKSKIGFNNC
jgi:hypothetical protein